ncbi:215_t:CDS:1, partial [Cetraspora pellucida]
FTSRQIHIPADQLNNKFKPIQDLRNYVNLRPLDACEYFYLQLTRNSQEIYNGNWFSKDRLGKNTLSNMMKEIARISGINITDQRITNHSGRRTAIQLLSDLNINEHEMMQFSGHRSTDELRTYKIPNNEQRLKNSTLLLDALQEFPIMQQEKSQQEEFQVTQQEESQVMQQEESQVIQQEESHVIQQEESQIMRQKNFQVIQLDESQVMQHEFQTTQQITQDNSS